MLDPQHRPDPQELRSIEETLEQLGESLWAAGPLDGVLKSWVHSASAEGKYTEALERPERADTAPIVHLAPALILRRRTERSFIRAFQEIIDQLNSDHPVPQGCRTFVSVSEDSERGNGSGESGHAAGPGEIYFPLPANEAQREIVRRLGANQGVLVQGPPGTGKSHTIVNLICHAAELDELVSLARNDRVSQWETGVRVSIELANLPTSDAFEQAVRLEREARATYEDETPIRRRPEYSPLEAMNEEDRRKLAVGLRDLVALIDRIQRRPLPWTEEATKQILGDFERTWCWPSRGSDDYDQLVIIVIGLNRFAVDAESTDEL